MSIQLDVLLYCLLLLVCLLFW